MFGVFSVFQTLTDANEPPCISVSFGKETKRDAVRSLEASWVSESKVLLKTKWSNISGLQGFPQQGSKMEAAGQLGDRLSHTSQS